MIRLVVDGEIVPCPGCQGVLKFRGLIEAYRGNEFQAGSYGNIHLAAPLDDEASAIREIARRELRLTERQAAEATIERSMVHVESASWLAVKAIVENRLGGTGVTR